MRRGLVQAWAPDPMQARQPRSALLDVFNQRPGRIHDVPLPAMRKPPILLAMLGFTDGTCHHLKRTAVLGQMARIEPPLKAV